MINSIAHNVHIDVFKETTYCVTCGIETECYKDYVEPCNKMNNESDMKHCDGCGEDYPRITFTIYRTI
jgi:hypothetical protein